MLSCLQEVASSTPGAGVSDGFALGWCSTPQEQPLVSASLPLAAITCITSHFIRVRSHSRAVPQVPGWSQLYGEALLSHFLPAPARPGNPHPVMVTTTVVSAGKYGQLGHKDNASSDQPRRVEYLVAKGLRAEEVVCGPWTTYICVLEP